MMRLLAAILLIASGARAQFKSTVPLVVSPATVTDAKGHYVDGLEAKDLVLYDNNVPQPIQIDYELYPISLAVVVQNSDNSQAMLDKLGRSGILFSQLLAGDAGETAVLSFSNDVQVEQDFTTEPEDLVHAMRTLKVRGDGAVTLDAVMEALRMLGKRPANRRKIILMIAEKRVRSATVNLQDVVLEVQRQNALIYWLTYSPTLTQFTARPKTMNCDKFGKNCELAPSTAGPMNIVAGLAELYHLSKPDVSELFSKATGARTINFLKRSGLEDAITSVGEEVHRQYILTFQPSGGAPGKFHTIRVEVVGRPDLQARARAGYWTVQ